MPENEETSKQNNVSQFEQAKDCASGKTIQLSRRREHLFIMNARICNLWDIVFWFSCFSF